MDSFVDFGRGQCSTLSKLFPAQGISIKEAVYEYDEWRAGFWSQQQSGTQPACIFQPRNAEQVSIAVLLARYTVCPFAIKSGGHGAFAGSSSIESGFNIDLDRLKSITLTADKKVAKIGPGNRWFDVYDSLEPHGLAVIGGRVADIGVGGLTLGGMLSAPLH